MHKQRKCFINWIGHRVGWMMVAGVGERGSLEGCKVLKDGGMLCHVCGVVCIFPCVVPRVRKGGLSCVVC